MASAKPYGSVRDSLLSAAGDCQKMDRAGTGHAHGQGNNNSYVG
jgi:hypothetical protein